MTRQQSKAADAARGVVHRALAHQAGLYPELDLAPLDTGGLDPRDAAFAHAVYDAVLRRWITLGYLIDGYTQRGFGGLDPRVRGVLLAGAAQLLLLDRVPPHAALHESVEWAKSAVPKAAGLVNAVLRRVSELVNAEASGLPEVRERGAWTGGRDELPLSDGTAVKLSRGVLPEDRWERLEVAASCPGWLLGKWRQEFGDDAGEALAVHGLVTPPTVLNTRFAQGEVAGTAAHEDPGHRVFVGRREDLGPLLAGRADVWVQDAASGRAVAAAAECVAGRRVGLVLDLCAGQGTKTTQLSWTFPGSRVVATDVDERRARELVKVARRRGNVEVVAPGREREFVGKADVVLLDVPCTNTGVLARRVEARYRCGAGQLTRMVAVQREILKGALGLVAEGGVVVYSTCSVDREENEEQVAWAEWELGLKAVRVERVMPRGMPGGDAGGYRDGGFSAVLRR